MLSAFSLTGCDYISKRLPTGLFPNTKEVTTEQAKQEIKIVGAPQTEITIEKERDDAVRLTDKLIEPIIAANTTLIEPTKPVMQVAQAAITPTPNIVTPAPVMIEGSKIATIQPQINRFTPATTSTQPQKPSSTRVHLEQQNIKEQLRNLETRVEKITEILDKMSPAMTRLIGIESEVSNLSLQLQSLVEQNKQQQLVHTTIVPKTPIATTQMVQPNIIEPDSMVRFIEPAAGIQQNIQTENTLYKIRSGDHKGKTRIVFETDQKAIPKVNIDNSENIMSVIFEGNQTSHNLEQRINNIANTSSFIQEAALLKHPENDNFMIAFDLKKSSNVIAEEYIAPNKENPFHRFVLDIKN